MLSIDIRYTGFLFFFNKYRKNKIICLSQCETSSNEKLWKLTFSKGVNKIVRLSGDSYRSRWWLVLTFQTLDNKENYSLVIARVIYPKWVFQKLSAYLWLYA